MSSVGFETGNVRRFAEVVGGDREILAWCAETYRRHDPAMLDAMIEFKEMHGGYDGDKLLPAISTNLTGRDPVLASQQTFAHPV